MITICTWNNLIHVNFRLFHICFSTYFRGFKKGEILRRRCCAEIEIFVWMFYSVGRLSLLSSSLQLLLPPLRSFLLVLQSFQQKLELVQLQFLLLLSSFVHHFLLYVLFQHRHFYDHFLPHFQLFLQQLCNRRPCEHHFLLRSSLQLYHFQYAR